MIIWISSNSFFDTVQLLGNTCAVLHTGSLDYRCCHCDRLLFVVFVDRASLLICCNYCYELLSSIHGCVSL